MPEAISAPSNTTLQQRIQAQAMLEADTSRFDAALSQEQIPPTSLANLSQGANALWQGFPRRWNPRLVWNNWNWNWNNWGQYNQWHYRYPVFQQPYFVPYNYYYWFNYRF